MCDSCAFGKSHKCCLIPCDDVILKRVDKEHQYRPYKDTEEMLADYKERFNVSNVPSFCIPLIWVKNKGLESMKSFRTLVTTFGKATVCIYDAPRPLYTLFDEFTYLDGSPCGKVEG